MAEVEQGSGQSSEKSGGLSTEAKVIGGSAAAASSSPAISGGLTAVNTLNLLKTMFFQGAALASNLASSLFALVVSGAMSVASAIGGALASAGAAVAAFTGGLVSAAAGAVVTALAVAMVVGTLVSSVVSGGGASPAMQAGQYDGSVLAGQCSDQEMSLIIDSVTTTGNSAAGQQTLANAQRTYQVLSAWGMSDENVAGILGNWDIESKIDPTSVETIYDEAHVMGPKKQAAEAAKFAASAVLPASYRAAHPTIEWVGIGLGQWTNTRNQRLLEHAAATKQPWNAIDTQLVFMASNDDPLAVQYFRYMISTPMSSDEATRYFFEKWEGAGNSTLGQRQASARGWLLRIKAEGWTADKELGDSLLDQTEVTLTGANQLTLDNMSKECSAELASAGLLPPVGVGPEGWTMPSPGVLTSPFGSREDPINGGTAFHRGADFSGGCGTPIYAAADGVVQPTEPDGYGGLGIAIDHGGGYSSRYWHEEADGILVKPGDKVKAGQHIGMEGNSGYSTGCHTHFEIRYNGTPIDPIAFLKSRKAGSVSPA